ncbi:hypothetical protein F3Y22_tig00111105pilonHSYRG00729 [Hibiscus syriacus]|uniref:RING-CH-type domain-containing protein n=1 Tax=Hibiscus syriacus TaxID=106335 RepID=A0A6A2YZ81_HIBSY|nr:uncharacterized protein LOC120153891 [Hibiscus syriacus]KAE8684921.1 hypothetical protein F3Y22_tig00111105pilonHSYRG00729 [Hibiscus syriacus]
MEALPKQQQGAVVVIDIDDGGEEEQVSQTDNEEEGEDRRSCSSSCSNKAKSGTTEIIKERRSSVSSLEVYLESETKLHLENVERDCRICHLSLDPSNQECDLPIELGCSCKDDLAAAHKQCAEAWFKIKGNRICEICGTTARNVAGPDELEMMEQWNDSNDSASAAAPMAIRGAESRNFWQGHRFLNFLLACMVFAFVISWLFHFNIPS